MSYAYDLCLWSDGPVQMIGVGHHYLLWGEACFQQCRFYLSHAAGGHLCRAVRCSGHRRAEQFTKNPVRQSCPGHYGGKAEHHSTVIAAHHGAVARENDSLARRLWHRLLSIPVKADNVVGQEKPNKFLSDCRLLGNLCKRSR